MGTPQRVTLDGVEVAYETFGAGEPLVLLHGGFGTLDMFGPNRDLLAEDRLVIGVDLQSHGRTPAPDRPMSFPAMAGDVAALIRHLGYERAAVMGFSLGGGVALRLAIDHPQLVERLVVLSAPCRRGGWHPEMTAGMDAMGPEIAEPFKSTPMYPEYVRVAPRPEDWPRLVLQLTTLMKKDYDWSAEVTRLPMPVMLVAGDADGLPPAHLAEFFALLGGGRRDAGWDGSGKTRHRLAILPGLTHYDINLSPAVAAAVRPFLRGA